MIERRLIERRLIERRLIERRLIERRFIERRLLAENGWPIAYAPGNGADLFHPGYRLLLAS